MKDDILIVRYNSDQPIDLETARAIVNQRKIASDFKPVKVLTHLPKLNAANKEAREYMSSQEAKEGITASAIVTPTLIGQYVVNFYLKVNLLNKTDFPIRLFKEENKAIEWLSKLD